MSKLKVLNLYSALLGNRELWENAEVTNVEINSKISNARSSKFPNDKFIIGDAKEYLLDHYSEFDFIWASPPCQANTRMIRSGKNRKPRLPDLTTYELILFLKYNFTGHWVVENVIPYYDTLIKPTVKIGRHLFWSNFPIKEMEHKSPKGFINKCNTQGANDLKKWLGIDYVGNLYYENNHDPAQVLRNCVHPKIGLHVKNCIPK